MDGSGDHTASPMRGGTVPQIPVEYDDLNMANGSFNSMRDFSTDINRKMKVDCVYVSTI